MNESKVGVVDYLILCLILLISVAIGLLQGYKSLFTSFFSRVLHNKVENSGNIELSTENTETIDEESGRLQEKNTKTSEYLTGNASMSAWPIAFSLLATFMSTNAVLGYPVSSMLYIQYRCFLKFLDK